MLHYRSGLLNIRSLSKKCKFNYKSITLSIINQNKKFKIQQNFLNLISFEIVFN